MDKENEAKFDWGDRYTAQSPLPSAQFMASIEYTLLDAVLPHLLGVTMRIAALSPSSPPRLLDLGSSYGLLAMTLNDNVSLPSLAAGLAAQGLLPAASRADAVAAYGRLAASLRGEDKVALPVLALDASQPALDFALAARLVAAAVHADLEANAIGDEDAQLVAQCNVLVCTGAIGYVTEKTIGQIAPLLGNRGKETAAIVFSVLRMFPHKAVVAELERHGFAVRCLSHAIRQRSYESDEEKEGVVAMIREREANGLVPPGVDDEDALYATLFVAARGDAASSVFGGPSLPFPGLCS